jgi:hypothetical protein
MAMSLTSAAIRLMADKGMSAHDIADIAAANEKRADPTATERKRRQRARDMSRRDVTRDPPNDNTLTPGSEAKASSPKYPAPDGVPDDVWDDFLKSPKRRKAGMSATAYSGIKNNLASLAEHGFPPGEMIALAVERGWITVKLEWVQNNERKPRSETGDGLSPTTRAALSVFGGG